MPAMSQAQSKLNTQRPSGYTIIELLAALSIIGILAAMILPRVAGNETEGKAAACHAQQGEIETQLQLWRRINGSFPTSLSGSISTDLNYFPEGVPTCPVDGSDYMIDATTGRIIGHDH